MDYSILMSVYHKENPTYFKEAIESMLNQTVKSNDFVIVCDGPLTEELYEVLDFYEKDKKNCIHRLQLEKNQGLGIALQKGILECNNELIARMDSDDIAVKNRIEMQLKEFEKNQTLAICGGNIEEFKNEIGDIDKKRIVPKSHEQIIKYSKKRNPFNHMTVMLKKSMILDVDNYQDMKMFEDYFLWMRVIQKYQVINLQETLVFMRIGNGMYARRGGVNYILNEYKLQKTFYLKGYINKIEFIYNMTIRTVLRLIPNRIRGFIYSIFLRER